MSKIIFVNRYFYPDHSATSQLLSELSFALSGDARNVAVVTGRRRYDASMDDSILPGRESVEGVDVYRCGRTNFGRARLLGRLVDYFSFYLSASRRVAMLARRGDVVVAMTDPPLMGVFLFWIVRLRGAHQINWLQDVYPELAVAASVPGMRGPISRALAWLRDFVCQRSVSVVLGTRMRDQLLARGITSDKLRIIQNWAPARLAPVVPGCNGLRQAWSLGDRIVVGYSGNMGRVHDFEAILEAARLLQNDNRFVFVFIGAGSRQTEIASVVKREALQNIVFKPYQPLEKLAESLSAVDIHLCSMPSEFEGLVVPSKIYGIAAVGRPAIFVGSEKGEIANLLQNYEFGHVVPSNSGQALCSVLQRLAESPSERKRLGSNARTAYVQHFSLDIVLAEWCQLIDAMKLVDKSQRNG